MSISFQGVLIRLGVRKFSPNGSLQVSHVIEDYFTHAPHSGVSGVDKHVTGVGKEAGTDCRASIKLAELCPSLTVPESGRVVS